MLILTRTWRNSREKGEEFNMVSGESELKKGLGQLFQSRVREWTTLPHGTEKPSTFRKSFQEGREIGLGTSLATQIFFTSNYDFSCP